MHGYHFAFLHIISHMPPVCLAHERLRKASLDFLFKPFTVGLSAAEAAPRRAEYGFLSTERAQRNLGALLMHVMLAQRTHMEE